MCYSGICIWEQYNGDCGFPTIKAVRDKYPLPLCGIPESEEYLNKVEDVKKLYMKPYGLRDKLKLNLPDNHPKKGWVNWWEVEYS